MKKTNFYIYTLSDPITNQIRYVGKTNDPADRIKRHQQKCYLNKYDKNTYKSNWIKSLINKGMSPIMEIVEECNENDVNNLEIYWISQFKSWGFRLTNLSEGGEVGVDWTGRKHSDETKEKIRNSQIKNPMIQYDLYGNIINKYESLMEAASKTGIHIYLISNCCKKKGSYTVGGGHFWRQGDKDNATTFRYEGDIFDYAPYNKNIQINSKKVCKYDLDGKLIETYDSVRSASVDNNKSNITSCCKRKINKKTGKYIVVKGYTWRYFDETHGNNL